MVASASCFSSGGLARARISGPPLGTGAAFSIVFGRHCGCGGGGCSFSGCVFGDVCGLGDRIGGPLVDFRFRRVR